MTAQSKHATPGKASFDHVYNLEDPRGYVETLGAVAYRTPHHAQPIIRALLRATADRGPATVTDVCCSYGINAALVKHDLTLDELYARYRSDELAGCSTDELADADERFFKDRRLPDPPRIVGVDVADRAVAYALRVGLLDEGAAENLETADPSPELAESLAPTDLVTITGGVGYITARTYRRVLDRVGGDRPPWVVAFPLRTVDYAPYEEVLRSYGLVTETVDRTFPQRRFVDDHERQQVLRRLAERTIDATGREATGYHHAQLFLSRPREDVEQAPITDLLADAT